MKQMLFRLHMMQIKLSQRNHEKFGHVMPEKCCDCQQPHCETKTPIQSWLGHDAARFVTQWWKGNREASLLLLACRFLRCLSQWRLWLGSRVGEAKNPGPAGTRSTARKRAQKGADSQNLAMQLLSVLENFQGTRQTKRAKTNPGLAQLLLDTLNTALYEKWPDTDIADTMIETLQPFVNVSDEMDLNCDKPNWDDWKQTDKHGGWEWSAQSSKHYQPQNETWHKPGTKWQDRSTDQWPAIGQTSRKETQSTKLTTSSQPPPVSWKGPKFAAKVQWLEWNAVPTLCTLNQIKSRLEEGKPVEANLLVTKDPEVWKEIQHLWNAYGVNASLTVATVASATSSGQTVSVWWDLAKQHSHKPFRTKVELRQATQTPGPVPIKAKAIDLKIDESARPVTVRILAPEFYRRFVLGVQGMDNPQTIISEVAQMLGCRTATLCGGNWQVVQHKHGTIVIGHVKVAPDLAQKLVPLSGKRALFFTKVDKQTKSLVAWISRAKETTAEDYFNHAWTQAQNKKLPLVLRQGGNNDLGIASIAATDLDQNQPRSFQLLGAPRYWNHEDILVFLKKTQWKDAEIKDRLRRGPEVAWIFKAVPAPLQNSDDKGVF